MTFVEFYIYVVATSTVTFCLGMVKINLATYADERKVSQWFPITDTSGAPLADSGTRHRWLAARADLPPLDVIPLHFFVRVIFCAVGQRCRPQPAPTPNPAESCAIQKRASNSASSLRNSSCRRVATDRTVRATTRCEAVMKRCHHRTGA